MRTTWNKWQKEQEELVKKFADETDKMYEKRDREVKSLEQSFLTGIGLGLDTEFELMGEDETEPEKSGWTVWIGEETTKVWRDGKEIGKMWVSCRGQVYRAGWGNKVASDGTNGQWVE